MLTLAPHAPLGRRANALCVARFDRCNGFEHIHHASVSDAERTVPSEPRYLNVSDVSLVACTTSSPLIVGVTLARGNV